MAEKVIVKIGAVALFAVSAWAAKCVYDHLERMSVFSSVSNVYPSLQLRQANVLDLPCGVRVSGMEHYETRDTDGVVTTALVRTDPLPTGSRIINGFDVSNMIPLIRNKFAHEVVRHEGRTSDDHVIRMTKTWELHERDERRIYRYGLLLTEVWRKPDDIVIIGMFDGFRFDPKSVRMYKGKSVDDLCDEYSLEFVLGLFFVPFTFVLGVMLMIG